MSIYSLAVKAKSKPEAILKQIARIQWMERGKLCPMLDGAYYNHQTWQNGRNVVRYVPRQRVAELKKALAGYQQYLKLTQAYVDEIIRRTRQTQTTNRLIAKNVRKPNKPEI
jgi:hypothetical protein